MRIYIFLTVPLVGKTILSDVPSVVAGSVIPKGAVYRVFEVLRFVPLFDPEIIVSDVVVLSNLTPHWELPAVGVLAVVVRISTLSPATVAAVCVVSLQVVAVSKMVHVRAVDAPFTLRVYVTLLPDAPAPGAVLTLTNNLSNVPAGAITFLATSSEEFVGQLPAHNKEKYCAST